MSSDKQIKFLETTRQQTLAQKAAAAGTQRSRICGMASRPVNVVDTTALATELRKAFMSPTLAWATSKSAVAAYNGAAMQIAFRLQPIDPAYVGLVREADLSVEASDAPTASASPTFITSPTIVVSSGLIASLCRATGTAEDYDQVLERIDRRLAELRAVGRGSNDPFNDGIFQTTGPLMDLGVGSVLVQHQEVDFIIALLFVLGHELSHALFDGRSSPNFSAKQRELRADVFGYVVVEAAFGAAGEKRKANQSLARTFHWSTSSVHNGLLVTSTEGYRTTFELVYVKAGLVEGNQDHPPMSERLAALDAYNSKMIDPH